MARYAEELVSSKAVGTPSFTHRVQQLILMLMPLGQCQAELVAAHLGCDRRTVTRRLQAEQTGFHQLVNAHRRHMVAQYLQDKSRPLSHISNLLGFASPSAFSRWHRQEFGVRARDA